MTARRGRISAAVAAMAAIVAGATGCASSGSGGAAAPSPTASVVSTIPSSALVHSGQLTECVDLPFEPLQYSTPDAKFTGLDIDLMTGVAQRLGLTSNPVNTDYATVVAALDSGKCDVIVSDQYITPQRQQQVNMVAYWKSNETLIVPSGNPKHVTGENGLCGLAAAGEAGGLEIDIMKTLSTACTKAGKKPIQIQQYAKSPDALQAVLSGHADVWMASELTAATLQKADSIKVQILTPFTTPATVGGLVAMSFVKSKPAVMNAVLKALAAMTQDGSYQKLFAKYHMTSLMVNPPKLTTPAG